MRRFTNMAIVLCLSSTCLAQPATAPAAQPTWQITITGVEGISQGRIAADQPWTQLAVGMQFPNGAEIRNGVRSAVRFTTPSGQEVVLDRLGVYKIDPETIQEHLGSGATRIMPSTSTLRIYIGPPRLNDRIPYPLPTITQRPVRPSPNN